MDSNNLTFRLFDVIKRFRKTFLLNQSLFEKLNMNDLIVCGFLKKNEEDNILTQVKDFSEYMNISRPAVNTILNRLEDRYIIKRVRLKDDRKSVYVQLTHNAYKLFENEKEKISKSMDSLIKKLGEEETLQLINILEKVNVFYEKESR